MSLGRGEEKLVAALGDIVTPLGGDYIKDFAPLIRAAKGKQYVLIGEATHGTKEFYRTRAEITAQLIQNEGFDAVAVEADWPDAYRVNRFVSCLGNETASEALMDFERFPTWMWRNSEVLRFIDWLHRHNCDDRLPEARQDSLSWPAGFYGLDLYSMNSSIHAVIDYLEKVDPKAARQALVRYSCLDHFMEYPESYGYATESGFAESCEDDIVEQLTQLRRKSYDYIRESGYLGEDEYFSAIQNAELVRDAEKYYRAMVTMRPNSWNIRDKHMFDCLENLSDHLGNRLGREARIVVWAHNSHIGNAAATEMQDAGEFNIGQLVRGAYGDKALLVGFSTCRRTVTAADNWDEPAQTITVNDPLPHSYEDIFHHVRHDSFLLDLRQDNEAVDRLAEPRLQRAIGVVYRPGTERQSHYFYSHLPEQFDFLIHYDHTSAVSPLFTRTRARLGEMDETYPYGL